MGAPHPACPTLVFPLPPTSLGQERRAWNLPGMLPPREAEPTEPPPAPPGTGDSPQLEKRLWAQGRFARSGTISESRIHKWGHFQKLRKELAS